MKIFETHAHYDDEAFREDREALFDEMFANDIDTIINVGASFAGCEQSVALADSHEKIYAPIPAPFSYKDYYENNQKSGLYSPNPHGNKFYHIITIR